MVKAKKVEKKDNKNLITIVLLIIAGIVILSYTNITGRGVSSTEDIKYTSAVVIPRYDWDREINPGDYITVKLEPGTYGYETYYELYKIKYITTSSNERIRDDKVMVGRTKFSSVAGCSLTCKKKYDLNIKTSDWEPNIYYVKVLDKSRERDGKTGEDRYIKAEFKIV